MFGLVKLYKFLKKEEKRRCDELQRYCDAQEVELFQKGQEIDLLEQLIAEERDGLKRIAADEKKKEVETVTDHYFKEVVRKESAIARLRNLAKSLEAISNEITTLAQYENFYTEEEFNSNIMRLVQAHQRGLLTQGDMVTSREDALKYKTEIVKGRAYKVKDNRAHYADMALIDREGKVLLVKRRRDEGFEPDKYCLPGGHIEPAEDPLRAAVRECYEETGITVDPDDVKKQGVYEDEVSVINYFSAPYFNDLPVLDSTEMVNFEWRSYEEIMTSEDLILNLRENFENELIVIEEKQVNEAAGRNAKDKIGGALFDGNNEV